jgi:hypothetical protein
VAGGTEFKRGKLKELVLYFSQQSLEAGDEGFGMVKLNKLLYRADFESFRLLGRSITGAVYEKQEYGPVARDLLIVLDELAASGYLTWQLIPRGPRTRKVPTATPAGAPDLGQFAPDELEIMRMALDDLAVYGGKQVSRWSHQHSAGWRAKEIGEVISYESELIDPNPADAEALAFLRQLERIEVA